MTKYSIFSLDDTARLIRIIARQSYATNGESTALDRPFEGVVGRGVSYRYGGNSQSSCAVLPSEIEHVYYELI